MKLENKRQMKNNTKRRNTHHSKKIIKLKQNLTKKVFLTKYPYKQVQMKHNSKVGGISGLPTASMVLPQLQAKNVQPEVLTATNTAERRNSYETQLMGGTLPDDLQRKLFESICSNMNGLFVKNSANFESTINAGIKALLETEDIKGQFQTAIVSMFQSFANDEKTKLLMNDKIEAQILDSVAKHIESKLPSDVRASTDDIKNIMLKYPEVMAKMSSPTPTESPAQATTV